MLKRRKFNITGDFLCHICLEQREETLEHLFFSCPYSISCLDHIGLDITYIGHLDRFQIISEAKIRWNKPLFMETFAIAAWNIWKERNNWCFNNIRPSLDAWTANGRRLWL